MDDNEKARLMIEGFHKVADEFNAEGKPQLADQTLKALDGVPVGSLAKLFDIITKLRS